MMAPSEKAATSKTAGGGTIRSMPAATSPARPSAVCGSGGASDSP
jgi:hypothetical protein